MSRRTATRPEVRITAGGVTYPLSSIVPQDRGWGELEHSTRTNGGWEVSWTIPIVRNWRHPALIRGARVDVALGPLGLIPATLDEPDWDAGRFIAIGACREAETAVALDGSGNSSTAPNTVIDAAIARGVLSWTRVADFGSTPVGDSTSGVPTVKAVLDAWADKNNSRWFVNAQRQLVILPVDESVAKWLVVPGSGVLGSAAEERVDRVFARYIDSATGQRATATYPAATPVGGSERTLDITTRGAMSAATAQGIAQARWAELQGRSGWTNGLNVANGQVTTIGGNTADLAMLQAGETVCLLGVPDARGVAMNTNVVLAETSYKWEDDEVQLNPVGLAARDIEGALETVGNLAVSALTTSSSGNSIGIGQVMMWYGAKANCPAGWLVLDGSAFSGTDYPALSTFLGSTTLPDFTDRVPVGVSGTKALGAVGGAITHSHPLSDAGQAQVTTGGGDVAVRNSPVAMAAYTESARARGTNVAIGGGLTAGAALRGNTDAASSYPPYRAIWFIIRAV